jgi:hypothetical protein
MTKRLFAAAAATSLLFAACGGSDSVQDEAADLAIASISGEGGVQLDEDCVRDVAGDLSDEDAQAILDSGGAGDAELSPEGEATALGILGCVDQDAFIDQVLAEVGDTPGLDTDCLREALSDLDLSTFDEDDPGFAAALLDCVDLSQLDG